MKYFLPILLLLTLASCKKIRYYVPPAQQIILNVAYGADPAQKMDVYLPFDRSSQTPVVILLHGGAFVAGQKEDFTQRALALEAAGYAVINVNYRLVDGEGLVTPPPAHKLSAVKVSEQLDDIKAAVEFVAKNAKTYLVSESKWGMAGHSAGGTLALLYVYGNKNDDGKIKAVANWAGVTDFSFEDEAVFNFADPRFRELYYRLTGKEPVNTNLIYFKNISPVWIAAATQASVPVLNIRPEFNSILGLPDISAPQYAAFTTVLNTKKIDNKFLEIKNVDHGFSGKWEPVITATVAYFNEKIK